MQKVYRLIIIGVLMSALGSLGLSAQIKGYNIVVSVTPDHQDWNYKVGEKANVLEIGIHGIPVTMEQKVYDDLQNGELNGYWDTNLENPDRNSYKR